MNIETRGLIGYRFHWSSAHQDQAAFQKNENSVSLYEMRDFFDRPRLMAGFHIYFYQNQGVQQSAQAHPPRTSVGGAGLRF